MTVIAEPGRTRLAVLGSPIAHSRSPRLHAAAYAALGLDWRYERHDVGTGGLARFVADLSDDWRGLSITMPLKPEAYLLSSTVSDVAIETEAVNTLLLRADGIAGFNTDVYGVMQALRDAGVRTPEETLVVGAGATARSVASALRRMGGTGLVVAARRADAAEAIAGYARGLGLTAKTVPLDAPIDVDADLVVNTIPGGATADLVIAPRLAERPLLEVAYDPWPSPLVARWDGKVISGLDMLVHQAVAQVRIFVSGDPHTPLPDETGIVAAMRASLD